MKTEISRLEKDTIITKAKLDKTQRNLKFRKQFNEFMKQKRLTSKKRRMEKVKTFFKQRRGHSLKSHRTEKIYSFKPNYVPFDVVKQATKQVHIKPIISKISRK